MWTLVAITLIGFGIRVFYILDDRAPLVHKHAPTCSQELQGDAIFYHCGAQLLADGKGFINPFDYDLRNHEVNEAAEHPPLYILYLWVPTVLGLRTPVEHMIWSAVLGAATIVLVGLAGREIAGRRAGLIAAFFAAVYPNVFSHDGVLTSETMSIFTATLSIWMAYRFWRAPSLWRAVALAAAIGLGAMARAELFVLVPFVLIPMVLARRQVPWKRRLRWLGASALVLVVIIGPWVGFNNTRFRKPVFLGLGQGITLRSATCDVTYGLNKDWDRNFGKLTGYWATKCVLGDFDKIRKRHLDQSEAETVYRNAAYRYMDKHGGHIFLFSTNARVVLARWARITGIWDLLHNFQQVDLDHFPEGREYWIAWGGLVMFYAFALLSIVGVVVLRRRRIPVYPCVALFLMVFIVITIMFGQNRYRASAETALCLLAAVGVDAILERWRARGRDTADATPAGADRRAPELVTAKPGP